MVHVRYKPFKLRVWLGVLALAYVPLTNAAPAPPVGSGWVYGPDGSSWVRESTLKAQSQANGRAIWAAATSGGGATYTSATKVAFGVGAASEATIVAKGAVTGAKVFTAVKALTGGPVGIALLLAVPVLDWLTTENTRPSSNPTPALPVEKRKPKDRLENQYSYQGHRTGPWLESHESACQAWGAAWRVTNPTVNTSKIVTVDGEKYCYAGTDGSLDYYSNPSVRSKLIKGYEWLPASMDDIAPYMTPRPATPALIQAVFDAGGSLETTPVSVTGPASVISAPTVVNSPLRERDLTSSTVASGNPFDLVDGAPSRQVSVSQGTHIENIDGKPYSIPNRTESRASYDAPSNRTTTTTTTHQDPHTVTTTQTPTTTLTYTPNTVTTNTVNNISTTITNNTTNQTTTDTITKTDPKDNEPEKEEKEEKDPCEDNPDRLECLKTGDIPEAEKLIDTPFDLTITPTVFQPGGACPVPLSFIVASHSYAISYQPICDKLVYLKALFLMMASVVAAYILADSFRV